MKILTLNKYVDCVMIYTRTRRYSPLTGLTFSSCGGLHLWPRLFLYLGPKKTFLCVFAYVRPFLVLSSNLVTFSSNISKFEKNLIKN